MRYLFLIVIVVLGFGCRSLPKNNNPINDSQSAEVVLNEEEQRKFNYYFYEGNRYKALNETNKSFMYFAEALKIDSTCSSCAYELSRFLVANENLDEAEVLMDRAVRHSPDNRFYINLYSRILQANKKGEKAVEVSEKLLTIDDSSVEDLYFVSQVKIQNGLYSEAVDVLNIIEGQIGVNESLIFEKVQLYLENDEIQKAEDELLSLVNKYPGNNDFKIILGDFYLENGDLRKAYQQYENVFKEEPENGKVLFSLSNYYLESGDTTQFKSYLMEGFRSENIVFDNKFRRFIPYLSGKDIAENPLKKDDFQRIYEILIEKHPYQTEVYASYSEYLKSEGEEKKAKSILEKSLELDASQPELWQEYLFLISSLEDNELLKNKSSEAVIFFPEVPLFRLFQGISFFQTGDTVQSICILKKGLELSTDNPGLKQRFHAYLGDFYYSVDSVVKSFEQYEKALDIDENDVMVLNNYSYYLSVIGKELDKAERMSAKTIEIEPGNSTFLDTYAWILFKKGQFQEAKFIIERAIDNMKQPSAVIIEHYGDILFKNGDVHGALQQWEKALELPDHSKVLSRKIDEKRYIDEE
ncbi:CDC27 family protein [Marinilabilia sp.]|uniref:tetratricopeptide repeat protein n=1 Tax=Marinilabilia sp. TaxID=2021252 RepID=UPI0025BA56C9|nr:CDC27 family protein [Marinilabilia sp.]